MEINKEIISQIKEAKNVAIYTHTSVDADSIGSASALRSALEKLDKKVDIFCEDTKISEKYMCIPFAREINKPTLTEYDLAIAVDIASPQKIGKEMLLQFNQVEKTIKIDHHISGVDFAKLNFTCTDFSSCAMIIYHLIPMLGIKEIDKQMAVALYAGISGDTGCFRHSNTMALDHEIAAKLMSKGIDSHTIDRWLFKYTTMKTIALKQRVLGRFKKYLEGKMCLAYISLNDLKETHTTISETEGIINMIDVVDGCELSVLLCESKAGLYKASFRSVNTSAALRTAEAFGGGGHANASGCQIYGTLETVIKKIVKAAEVALDGKE